MTLPNTIPLTDPVRFTLLDVLESDMRGRLGLADDVRSLGWGFEYEADTVCISQGGKRLRVDRHLLQDVPFRFALRKLLPLWVDDPPEEGVPVVHSLVEFKPDTSMAVAWTVQVVLLKPKGVAL